MTLNDDFSKYVKVQARAETEAQFQNRVLKLARYRGWTHYHTYDSRRSVAGFPDLVLVHPRHGILYRELKTDKGTVSRAQQEWLHLLTVAGADAKVWRQRDWDQIQAELAGDAQ